MDPEYEYKLVNAYLEGQPGLSPNENHRNFFIKTLNEEGKEGWRFVEWHEDAIHVLMERKRD